MTDGDSGSSSATPVDLRGQVLGARHPRVGELRRTLARRGPRSPLVVLEGVRMIGEALDAGLVPETVVVPESAQVDEAILGLAARLTGPIERLVVRDHVFERFAPSVTPQPVLALARRPDPAVPATLSGDAVVLVLAAVSDPGNVGTLVRAADATGCACVVVAGGADPWGDKAIRASAGSILRIPVVRVDDLADELVGVLDHLRSAGATVVAADAHTGVAHTGGVLDPPVAIVLGSESHGLPTALDDHVDHRVRIDMPGGVESLNVAMAGTLLAFESRRPGA